jgi:hypothetical protein
MTTKFQRVCVSIFVAWVLTVGIVGTVTVAGGPILESDVQILYTHTGETIGDNFGWVGAKLGDLNHDGFDDYLTTAPGYTNSVSNRGKVYVYSGATGTLFASHTGEPGEAFGYSAATAGDVNKDGTLDYIVGGNGAYNPAVRGYARLYSGATHTELYEFEGEPGASFGSGVSGVGDVNGDGFDDVVVGSEWYSSTLGSPPPNGTGRIYLYSGANGALLWEREGTAAGDWLGSGVGSVSDVNNDGVRDVVASARRANNRNGLAYVFSGVDGTTVFTLTPTAPFSQSNTFGQFFAFGAGDFNNDNQEDIYIGDYGAANGDGRVYLYSGEDGSLIRAIDALEPGEGIGGGRGVPDLNGDGFDDLIIAAYTSGAGAPGGGKVYILSGADNEILHTITGAVAGDLLGVDALELGDVNNDGNHDYMVTAVGLDFNGQGVGSAYIVSFIETTAVALSNFTTASTLPMVPMLLAGIMILGVVSIRWWLKK